MKQLSQIIEFIKKYLQGISISIAVIFFVLTIVDLVGFSQAETYNEYHRTVFAKQLATVVKDSLDEKNTAIDSIIISPQLDCNIINLAYDELRKEDEGKYKDSQKWEQKLRLPNVVKIALVKLEIVIVGRIYRYTVIFFALLAAIIVLGVIQGGENEQFKISIYFAAWSILVWGIGGYFRLLFWKDDNIPALISLVTSSINNILIAGLIPNITIGYAQGWLLKLMKLVKYTIPYYITFCILFALICPFAKLINKEIADMLDVGFSTLINFGLIIYLLAAFKERKMPIFLWISGYAVVVTVISQIVALSDFDRKVGVLLGYGKSIIAINFIFSVINILFTLIISFGLYKAKKEKEEVKSLRDDLEHRMNGLIKELNDKIDGEMAADEGLRNLGQKLKDAIEIKAMIHRTIGSITKHSTGELCEEGNLTKGIEALLQIHEKYPILLTKNIQLNGHSLESISYEIARRLMVLVNEMLNNARKYGTGDIYFEASIQSFTETKVFPPVDEEGDECEIQANEPCLFLCVKNASAKKMEEGNRSMGNNINRRIVSGLHGYIFIPTQIEEGEICEVSAYIPMGILVKK